MDSINQGKIKVLSANKSMLDNLFSMFNGYFAKSIHLGEAEALAVLLDDDTSDIYFCTWDATAIKAIAMIGKQEKGISFEKLLNSIGSTKKLREQFTQIFFQKKLKVGNIIRIQSFKSK